MTLTNFPNGISSFGMPQLGSSLAGNQLVLPPALFVDTVNGVNAGQGTSPTGAYQTLPYAVSQASANSFIFVLSGSAITVSSATALAVATAGLQIIGQGNGNARPTITLDTANTATIAVSAANVAFQNFIVIANFLSIATAFTLTTAKGFTLIGCDFRETSNVLNFLNIVTSTGGANTVDYMVVTDNRWVGLGTTSVNSFILSANAIAGAVWQRNTVVLARTADAPIFATITTGVLSGLVCTGNIVSSLQTATTLGSLIGVAGTTGTGLIDFNQVATLTTAADLLVTAGHKFQFSQNYVSGVADKSGFLIPAADS